MANADRDSFIRLINDHADYDELLCRFRSAHPFIQPTRKNLLRFVDDEEPVPTDAAGEELEAKK